jgi:hypothetical protein
MAEDKKEFQRRFTAFHDAGEAGDWDKAVKLGEALRTEFPTVLPMISRSKKL